MRVQNSGFHVTVTIFLARYLRINYEGIETYVYGSTEVLSKVLPGQFDILYTICSQENVELKSDVLSMACSK